MKKVINKSIAFILSIIMAISGIFVVDFSSLFASTALAQDKGDSIVEEIKEDGQEEGGEIAQSSQFASSVVIREFKFGSYPQSKVTDKTTIAHLNELYEKGKNEYKIGSKKYRLSNGNYYKYEKIEWQVIFEFSSNSIFVISKKVLDAKMWGKNMEAIVNNYPLTWENSFVRDWLNDTFLKSAFNKTQRSMINKFEVDNSKYSNYFSYNSNNTKDKVFLLSVSDLTNVKYGYNMSSQYDDSNRTSESTEYAISQGAGKGKCDYWTRSSNGSGIAYVLSSDGCVGTCHGLGRESEILGVRPAMNVNEIVGSGFYDKLMNAAMQVSLFDREAYGKILSDKDNSSEESFDDIIKSARVTNFSVSLSESGNPLLHDNSIMNYSDNTVIGLSSKELKNNHITFKADGYLKYKIPKDVAISWENDGDYTSTDIYLTKDDKSDNPHVLSVFGRTSKDDNAYKDLTASTLNVLDKTKYDIIITSDASSSSKDVKYYLGQTEKYITSTDGVFSSKKLSSEFDFNKSIYAYVKYDGKKSKKVKLNISYVKVDNEYADILNTSTVSFFGTSSQKVKVNGNAPIFPGASFSAGLMKIPLGVDITGDSVKISIGVNLFGWEGTASRKNIKVWKKESEWAKFKDNVSFYNEKKNKENLKKLDDMMKYYSTGKYNDTVKKYTNKASFDISILGYVEFDIKNGELVLKESAGTLALEVAASFTQQWNILGVPAFYSRESITGNLSATAQIVSLDLDNNMPYVFKTTLAFKPTVYVGAGVGVKDVVSIGFYGEASAPHSYQIQSKHLVVDVEGEFGIEADLLFIKERIPVLQGETNLVDKFFDKKKSVSKMASFAVNGLSLASDNKPKYTLASRDYAKNTSEFDTDPSLEGATVQYGDVNSILETEDVPTGYKTLQESVYKNSQTQLADLGDKVMLVWVEDDINRDTYNRYRLVYSLYDKKTKVWSTPKAVCDSNTMDIASSLVSDGTNTYIAWQNIDATIKRLSPSDITDNSEIKIARYDKNADAFVDVKTITNNSVYDYAPEVTIKDGKALVYYSENQDSDVSTSKSNLYRYFDGVTTAVVSDLDSVSNVIASEDDLSYITMTSSILTDEEGCLYDASVPVLYFNGKVVDLASQLLDSTLSIVDTAFGCVNGEKVLFVALTDGIYYVTSDGVVHETSADKVNPSSQLKVLNEGSNTIIQYVSCDENNISEIYSYSYKDGVWSDPVQITKFDSVITNLNTVAFGGQVFNVFDRTDITLEKDENDEVVSSTLGQTDLCLFESKGFDSAELIIDGIDCGDFAIGEITYFTPIIENKGTETITSITFMLSDGMGDTETIVKEVNIPSGEYQNVELEYFVKDTFDPSLFTIKAIVNGQYNNSVSSSQAEINNPNIRMDELSLEELDDYYIISGNVVNDSFVDINDLVVEVKLDGKKEQLDDEITSFAESATEDQEVDNVIATIEVGNIAAGEGKKVRYLVDKYSIDFSETDYAKIVFKISSLSNNDVMADEKSILIAKPHEHTFTADWVETIPATCVSVGERENTCDVCDDLVKEEIPLLETHAYIETVTEPTCTEKGYTEYDCKYDDDSYIGNYIDALGHNYVDGVCERCENKAETISLNEIKNVVIEKATFEERYIFAPEKSGEYFVSAEMNNLSLYKYITIYDENMNVLYRYNNYYYTFQYEFEADKTYYIGARLNDDYLGSFYISIVDDVILSHSIESPKVYAPTCINSGYTYGYCSRCNTNVSYNYKDSLGHSYVCETKEPTCITDGRDTYLCSRCNYTYYDNKSKLNHNFVDDICDRCEVNKYFEKHDVSYSASEGLISFEFTPEVTDYYYFFTDCDYNTYGYLYDSDETLLISSGYGGRDSNFKFSYLCEAGKNYIIKTKNYYDSDVDYNVYISNENYKSGHSYNCRIVEPNNGTPGYELYECEWCGNSYTGNYVYTKMQLDEDYIDGVETDGSHYYSYRYYNFIPDETGIYVLESSTDVSSIYTYNTIDASKISDISISRDGICKRKTIYQLEEGKTYSVRVEVDNYNSKEGTVVSRISKMDASLLPKSIEYIGSPLEIIENTNGYINTDSYDQEYFRYSVNHKFESISITYYDDHTEIFNYADGMFISENSDRIIEYNGFSSSDNQYSSHWTVGNTYSKSITITDINTDIRYSFEYPVTIVENPVKNIEFIPAEPFEFTEEMNGNWINNDEYYRYYVSLHQGDKLVVYFDNEIKEYYFDDESYSFIDEDGNRINHEYNSEGLNNWNWDYYQPQQDNHWVVDGDNYFEFYYCGKTAKVPVTIKRNPVESISYYSSKGFSTVENSKGNYSDDRDGNEYYSYILPWYNEGDVLTVNYIDGTSADYIFNNNHFVNEDGEIIDNNDISRDTDQYENHWSIGDNYFYIRYAGRKCPVKYTVIENLVESISYYTKEGFSVLENLDGYYTDDRDGNEYFYYYVPWYNEGDVLTVNYKDGTTVDYVFENNNFISEDGDVIDNNDITRDTDQYENHWSIGDNYFYIEYSGKKYQVPITITESSVDYIEFELANPIIREENKNGEWRVDNNGEEYFEYWSQWFSNDDVLIVHDKDGSQIKYTFKLYYDEDNDCYYGEFQGENGEYIDPNNVSFYSNQWEQHWTVGGDNYQIIKYMGAVSYVPVTIRQNLYLSISFTPAKPVSFIEKMEGYQTEDGQYIYDTPGFRIGDILTINYKDGSSKDFVATEYDEYDEYLLFFSSDGECISSSELDRYSNQWDNPWTLGVENYYYVEYKDMLCQVPVEIKENPYVSATFITSRTISIMEKTRGYYEIDDDGNEFFRYDLKALKDGDVIKLELNDGTSKKYTFVSNGLDEEDYFIDEDGKILSEEAYRIYSNQYDEHWTVGTNYYILEIFGLICEIPVVIEESNVEDIQFVPANELVLYDKFGNGYFSENSDGEYYFYIYEDLVNREGNKIIVTYNDGSQRTAEYIGENGYCFDNGEYLYFLLDDDQNENPWTIGGDNRFTISYAGAKSEVPVNVVKNPYTSIKYEGESIELIEGFNTYYDDELEYDIYRFDARNYKNAKLVASGESVEDLVINLFCGDDYWYWYDDNGTRYEVYEIMSQFENQWVVGGDNHITLSIGNLSANIPVNIIRCTHNYKNGFCTICGNDSGSDYSSIELNSLVKIPTNSIYSSMKYQFTPSRTGKYYFYSMGNRDTYGYLYDEDGEEIDSDDDSGEGNNFMIEYRLNAGETYTVEIRLYSNDLMDGKIYLMVTDSADHFHSFSNISREVLTESTCVSKGTEEVVYTCDNCDFEFEKEVVETEFGEHCYEEIDYVEPSDSKQGYIEYECIYCGDKYKEYISEDVDISAFEAAFEQLSSYSEYDVSEESYVDITAVYEKYKDILEDEYTQEDIDNAIREILTTINSIIPYLTVTVYCDYDTVEVIYDGESYNYEEHSILYGTDVTFVAPEIEDYVFVGWYDLNSQRILSTEGQYEIIVTTNLNLTAIYAENDSATITFANDSGWIKDRVTLNVSEWANRTNIDDLLPAVPYSYGKTNGRWVYDNATVLVQLRAGKNVTIVPAYEVEKELDVIVPDLYDNNTPTATLQYEYNEETKMGSFIMFTNIPENCDVIAKGMAFNYGKDFDPTKYVLTIDNKNTISQFDPNCEDDFYIVNARVGSFRWAAVGYISYMDEYGNVKTAYTNQVNIIDKEEV